MAWRRRVGALVALVVVASMVVLALGSSPAAARSCADACKAGYEASTFASGAQHLVMPTQVRSGVQDSHVGSEDGDSSGLPPGMADTPEEEGVPWVWIGFLATLLATLLVAGLAVGWRRAGRQQRREHDAAVGRFIDRDHHRGSLD